MKKRFTILFFCILVICSIFFRTYHYKTISLDYDEQKTIYVELKNTSIQSIYNYIFLQNAFKYREIDKKFEIGRNINICFPLYYIPLKIASIFRYEISFFRLITIIFGIFTPALLFLLGKRYSIQIGIMASVLLLFHPWAQHQSVHIRFYEIWSLISILCLWYVERITAKIKEGQTTSFHFVILAVCLLIPCTIHAFGVISLLFMVSMLLSHFYYNRADLSKISLNNKVIFGITFLIGAIIVGINLMVFLYATLIQTHPAYLANTESAIHLIVSSLFNFGYFYPLIIGASILVMILKSDYRNHTLNRYVFSIIISLLPVSLILLKPHAFRADFFYGILPYVLLLTALSINHLADELCKAKYINITIFSAGVTVFLIASLLPTFVSNVFIDYDRLDHIEAAKMISKIKGADVYATHHPYFNVYLNKPNVQQIEDVEPEKCHSLKDEYFFIEMRKGKSTNFSYDFRKLKDAQLVRIIGKDRIDLRASKIYVFFRKCTSP
jgi:hypothetical protein